MMQPATAVRAQAQRQRDDSHPGYTRYPDWKDWWLVARFKDSYPHDIPTPGHLQAMAAMVEGLGSPWNISTNWAKARWYHSTRGAIQISLAGGRGLATFDFDHMTKLVIAAHRHCVRVEVEPCNPQYIRVTFWPRDPDATAMFERHPTLADLIARINATLMETA